MARAMETFGEDGGLMLPCAMRAPYGDPSGMLVLLHGRGTDEHDIFPLLETIDPARRVLGIAPRGLVESDPEGHSSWLRREASGRLPAADLAETVARVGHWLDRTAEATRVALSSTVLGGFGEGALLALALAAAPGRPRTGGLILLSGHLPLGFDLAGDNMAGMPVALGYGLRDAVVTPAQAQALKRWLESEGALVTCRVSNGVHAVDRSFMRQLPRWIYRVLADVRYSETAEESGARFSFGTSVARPVLRF
jgi:predicted esterase